MTGNQAVVVASCVLNELPGAYLAVAHVGKQRELHHLSQTSQTARDGCRASGLQRGFVHVCTHAACIAGAPSMSPSTGHVAILITVLWCSKQVIQIPLVFCSGLHPHTQHVGLVTSNGNGCRRGRLSTRGRVYK